MVINDQCRSFINGSVGGRSSFHGPKPDWVLRISSLHTYFRRQAECSSPTQSLDSFTVQTRATRIHKFGPLFHPGEESLPTAFPRFRGKCLRPQSQSREECQLLGHVCQYVHPSVPQSNQNKVTKQSARLRCSPKPPLDYPISLSAAGLCRSRLSR
jgi:hypothetical protein